MINLKFITKTRLALLGVALFAAVSPVVVAAQNQILADPADLFLVNGPLANSTLSGTIITNWRVYDNDQASVSYELTLRDSQTCNNKFATISVGTKPSSSGTDATINWPSAGPLNDVASVPDGKYCMQLCLSMKNAATPYAACNLRIITIRNTNIPPQISSNPPSDRTINTDESWAYQVIASDANGDNLTYSLLNNPSFLTINASTGYIYTNSNAKSPAVYDITVVVKDSYGGTASQAFQLTVVAVPVVVTPPPATTPPPVTPPPATNTPSELKFVFPALNSEFKGDSNQVSWTATDAEGIKEVKLAYSLDKTNWLPIVTLSGDKNTYVWDVSKLTDGTYYLQLSVTDKTGAITTLVSDKFNIANNASPVPPTATKPLIISVKPEDASETSESRPEISGQFTPPVSSTMNTASFILKLDDVDITTSCTVKDTDFKCPLTTDLPLGVHKLHAEIKSNDGQTAMRDWTFTVVAKTVTVPNVNDGVASSGISSQAIVIVLGACVVIALLLLIPWMLYLLWRRRRNQQEDTQVYAEPQAVNPSDYGSYSDYLSAAATPVIPDITTNYYPVPVAAPAEAIVEAQPITFDASPSASQPVMSSPEPAQIDPNSYVTTPDFMSYYNNSGSAASGLENADVNVPDWLRAPEATPAPAAAVAVPVAPVEPTPIVNEPLPVSEPTTVASASDYSGYTVPLPAAIPPTTSTGFNPMVINDDPLIPAMTTPETTSPAPAVEENIPAANPLDAAAANAPQTDAGNDTGSYGYGRQVDSF